MSASGWIEMGDGGARRYLKDGDRWRLSTHGPRFQWWVYADWFGRSTPHSEGVATSAPEAKQAADVALDQLMAEGY